MSELIPIVAELTDKYTSRESSSVSYDKARQLMKAVLYCIQELEETEDGKNMAYIEGKTLELSRMYQAGYEQVLKKVERTKRLFEAVIPDFCAYGNHNYYDTVVLGIPEFLKYYDARFNPQDHILTLDYPTILSITPKCGVDAIYCYLGYIELEQRFLSALPKVYVQEVLMAYHPEYEELYCNICNIVLRNMMGCMIAEKPVEQYGFDLQAYQKISNFVRNNTKEEVKQKLIKLLKHLLVSMEEQDGALFRYLSADLEDFTVILINAEQNDCLQRVFMI